MSLEKNALNWFASGQVGASSRAMLCEILGHAHDKSHPWDPDDFIRCEQMLRDVPEAREHMELVSTISPVWSRFVSRWQEIVDLIESECGIDRSKSPRAPKSYALMQRIIDGK